MSYLQFKGVNNYGDFTITDEIQYGLQTYFEWGFLNIGAFTNVNHLLTNSVYTLSYTSAAEAGSGYLEYNGSGVYFSYGDLHHINMQNLLTANYGDESPTVTGTGTLTFTFDNANANQNINFTYNDVSANPMRISSVGTATVSVTNNAFSFLNLGYTTGKAVTFSFGGLEFFDNFNNSLGTSFSTWDSIPYIARIDGYDYTVYSSSAGQITWKKNGAYYGSNVSVSANFYNTLNGTLTNTVIGGVPTTGIYSRNEHVLRPVPNPNYITARVWEGYRNNWVWESGITYQNQPIEISGIYVNGSFLTNDNSQYKVDYPNGRIIFDNPISATSNVMCEYSYKNIKFTNADSIEGRQLHERTMNIDNQFMIYSGEKVEFDGNKLQLPAVVIETVPRKRFPRGTQLGGGHYLEQTLLFHVFTETPQERNKILDIIVNQHDSNIVIYDMNKLAENNMFPINLDGNIVNQNTRNYNNLVGVNSQYGYRQGIFKNIESQEQNILSSNLFGGIAKVVIEIGIPNV